MPVLYALRCTCRWQMPFLRKTCQRNNPDWCVTTGDCFERQVSYRNVSWHWRIWDYLSCSGSELQQGFFANVLTAALLYRSRNPMNFNMAWRTSDLRRKYSSLCREFLRLSVSTMILLRITLHIMSWSFWMGRHFRAF